MVSVGQEEEKMTKMSDIKIKARIIVHKERTAYLRSHGEEAPSYRAFHEICSGELDEQVERKILELMEIQKEKT